MKTYKLRRPPASGRRIDLDAELNDQQRAVVQAGTGPLLVIAGAGSGKTHTLTCRMAYLVDQGVPADQILLLTFTNRAARAMKSRASELVGVNVSELWGGTFHSTANRILRRYADRVGYQSDYTIIDTEDASTLMKSCVAGAAVGHLERRFPKPRLLCRIASFAANTGEPLDQIIAHKYPYFETLIPEIEAILRLYQVRKHEMNLLDFDDLLHLWYRLLVEHDDVRKALSIQFEHVLVDEYQDTNYIQGAIIDLMASHHGNLMVVGDDCQSIYAFRGADYRNILEFPERYPDCRSFRLETNYRSTPQILELANQSIAFNRNQFEKTLVAHRPDGPLPSLFHLKDSTQQAYLVCQRILELLDEGQSLNDIAVLYRSHHHSMELQLEMTRCGIPFVVRSGLRFFEQAHIKDALSYLRFLFNPRDELAFLRLVKQWPHIGQKRGEDIWLFLSSQDDPLTAVTSERLVGALPSRAASSWSRAAALIDDLAGLRLAHSPEDLLGRLLDGEFRDHLQASYENADNRIKDLEQLATYSSQFENLDTFLGEIALLSGISGQEIGVGQTADDEYVCLTSVHQAKGLEWHAVFVLNLSDGDFPHSRALEDPDGIEEERRLFYVAVTRAKYELNLCHPLTRRTRGGAPVVLRQSEFIEELRDEHAFRGTPFPFEDLRIDSGP